jgi:predicted transcriptional regulator
VRGGIAQLGLKQSETLVLIAFIDRADSAGVAWPSQYTLAAELDLARSTVQAALARLLELEALVVHEAGRQGRSTRYRIGVQPARSSGQLRAVN